MWQRSKLLSLELETTYLAEMSLNPESDWARKKAFADLQVVSDETAVGTFYLLQRQLESLGCVGVGREPPERFGTSPIRIYAYTSDGGSDQSKFKKLCGCLLEDDDSTLFMAFSCYMHCCQLIMKTGLNLTDSWFKRHVDPDVGKPFKYFATIAKLSYTWRDCSKPIYKTWVRKLGDVSAITHCKKIIPKCVAGRWGSIADVEQFLLQRKVTNIIRVIPAAFGFNLAGAAAFLSTADDEISSTSASDGGFTNLLGSD